MPEQLIYTIQSNKALTHDVYQMRLLGDTRAITRPGQFVNIQLSGYYLRRPLSVCDRDDQGLTLLYRVVGGGTKLLSTLCAGQSLDLLVGLGNGYTIPQGIRAPLVIGGGVGIPPLYLLCKDLLSQDILPTVVLGFNTAADVFYQHEFSQLGCRTLVTTVDGTQGIQGFATAALTHENLDYDYYFTCGPEPMLRAVHGACPTSGQLSFEERMGCGFGACMGCSCMTLTGSKRICVEGPVLQKEDVQW